MAHEIEVRLFGKPVGLLSLVAGRLNFQYAENWLAQDGAVALSQSLQLRAEGGVGRTANSKLKLWCRCNQIQQGTLGAPEATGRVNHKNFHHLQGSP